VEGDNVTIRYAVLLERGESSWGARVPDLPGCIAVGDTRDEALALVRDAAAFHLEGLRERGLPVPQPVSEGDVIEVGVA
jgi:predicted RNase H-like HicB family nuclease